MISYFKYIFAVATLSSMAMDNCRYSDEVLANGFTLLAMLPVKEYKEIFQTKTPNGLLDASLHPHAIRGVLAQDYQITETKQKLRFLIDTMQVKLDCYSGENAREFGEGIPMPLLFQVAKNSITQKKYDKAQRQTGLLLELGANPFYSVKPGTHLTTIGFCGLSKICLEKSERLRVNPEHMAWANEFVKVQALCMASFSNESRNAFLKQEKSMLDQLEIK